MIMVVGAKVVDVVCFVTVRVISGLMFMAVTVCVFMFVYVFMGVAVSVSMRMAVIGAVFVGVPVFMLVGVFMVMNMFVLMLVFMFMRLGFTLTYRRGLSQINRNQVNRAMADTALSD